MAENLPESPAPDLVLFSRVYQDLRKLAHRRMEREPAGHTLEPTALVHEAYLRLVEGSGVAWKDPAHFFALAALAMRRILVERARRYRRRKHGAGRQRLSLEQAEIPVEDHSEELIALDEALDRLKVLDRRKHDVVMLRYFAGLAIEEVAGVLGASPKTVVRDWNFARAWLQGEIAGGGISRGP